MKKVLFLILSLFLIQVVKADTIDYWHVYYNGRIFKKYNQNHKNQVIALEFDQIKENDSIKVVFFSDTRCPECLTSLALFNGEKDQVDISEIKEGIYSLTFKVKDLIILGSKLYKNSFPIYLIEEREEARRKSFLFRIVIH
jgi:hypothetical protein